MIAAENAMRVFKSVKLIEFMSLETMKDLCEYIQQNDPYLHAP